MNLLGIAHGVVQDIGQTAAPTASRVENRKRERGVQRQIREDGLRAGRAESARRMELFWKLELMPASLILRTSSSIEPLIAIGFLLERLVLEGAGVEAVELGLGLGDGLLEHGLAVDGFAGIPG